MFVYDITQRAPKNAVVLARLDGQISTPDEFVAISPSSFNRRLTSQPFFEDYSFNLILNSDEDDASLGVGVSNMESNRVVITNKSSDPGLGSPIPLFYFYLVQNVDIMMPVDQARYIELIGLGSPTPSEKAELNDANSIIRSSLVDRTTFMDLAGNRIAVKFNIEFTHVANNVFHIRYLLPDSPKRMGPLYLIYIKNGSSVKSLIRSTPLFQRVYWNKGSVFFQEQ